MEEKKTRAQQAKIKQEEVKEAMKVIPHSLEAEEAILGSILSDNEVAIDLVSDLSVEDFYSEIHKELFEEIKEINRNNLPVDIITLSNDLTKKGKLKKIGGMTKLTQLLEAVPSTANYQYYVTILQRNSLLRKIIRSCNEIIRNAHTQEDADKVLAVAESLIYNISSAKDTSSLVKVSDIMVDVMDAITEKYNTPNKEDIGGLRVGLDNLDQATNGFLPGQLLILAARPGCGKTSFCMNMVANLVKSTPESVIAVFNLEMSSGELVNKLISNIAAVNSKSLQRGEIDSKQMSDIWAANAVLNDSELYIDDSASISAEQVLSKCRRLKAQKGRLDFIIVDYLQLMSSSRPELSRQQQVSDMSRLMKIMAKELKVPVLVLSQMNRDIEKGDGENAKRKPVLSDLRESGAIEQDADMVMFLTEGEFELFNAADAEAPITLIIAKHRNGSIGELDYKWNKATTTFTPIFDAIHISKEKAEQNKEEHKELSKPATPEYLVESPASMPDYDYAPIDMANVPPPDEGDDIFAEIKNMKIQTKPNTEEM